jgi:hypothetical protein
MEREEYERKVLQELRGLLFEPDGRTRAHAVGYLGNRVQVEEVRIGVSRPEGALERFAEVLILCEEGSFQVSAISKNKKLTADG